jgi:uncharacterized 2Fe-2S/4Fe-4S cluster protein (DUF4445 family)
LQKVKISLTPLGKEIIVARGTPLIDVLHEFGVEFPCGGRGSCGKCKVKLLKGELIPDPLHKKKLAELGLSSEWRLACMSCADSDLVLEVGQFEYMIQADDTPFSFAPRKGYGIAVDLGTTTLVAQLLDLTTAKVLAVETALNPQRRLGSDLISRLESALAGKDAELTSLIREEVGSMLMNLLRGREISIDSIVLVGNTVMQHLFCNLDIHPLSFYPFESPELGIKSFSASELGWNLECREINFYPSIGSFVGSDILAGIYSTGMWQRSTYSILVDLGTNGEIVVGNRDKLLCASTAAGPAFEGAKISMGMLATSGAIASVKTSGKEIDCRVIGNVPATGICGSGLFDAVAVLSDLGLLGNFGEILSGDDSIELTESVRITAGDIQEFLLAKAAIDAGITILMRKLNIELADIYRIHIAGAFGNYINLESLSRLSMMNFPEEVFRKLGNSALIGAKMFLFSDQAVRDSILSMTSHVNLESEPDFQDVFIDRISLNQTSS